DERSTSQTPAAADRSPAPLDWSASCVLLRQQHGITLRAPYPPHSGSGQRPRLSRRAGFGTAQAAHYTAARRPPHASSVPQWVEKLSPVSWLSCSENTAWRLCLHR